MESRKKIKIIFNNNFFIIIAIFLSQACWFYSMKGSLPAHIHSISLAPVTNESAEFVAGVILNEELNELMISENVLDIVFPEQADSRLNVVITAVTEKPYTVILSDVGIEEVQEWKLTVQTTVTWYDMKRDEILFEKKMNSWGSYTPGVDISTDGLDNDGDSLIDGEDSDESGSPRESALDISLRRLTEDIVNEITNTW